MKTKRLLTTLTLLFIALFTTIYAQTKTKTITIVQNGDSKSITIDSLETITEEVTTTVLNNMNLVVNIDTLEGGEIVKKITITSSGGSSDADYAGERIMVMSAGDDAEVAHHGKYVMVMKGGDNDEEIVWNEKVAHHGSNVMVMHGSDNDGELIWHTKSPSATKETLNPVAVSDLHLLKKAGFSANTLTSEPLELKALNVDVKRIKTSDSDILDLSLDITMPEADKTTITLIDSSGSTKEEKTFKDSDKISVKFEMDKESAPYYVVVLQNKKVWTKKIEF